MSKSKTPVAEITSPGALAGAITAREAALFDIERRLRPGGIPGEASPGPRMRVRLELKADTLRRELEILNEARARITHRDTAPPAPTLDDWN